MTDNFDKLKSLFISNPSSGITESQRIICSVSKFETYKDFYTYHFENAHVSTCQAEWSIPEMAITCHDCAIDPQSCVCLRCFLNGNHQGHSYEISTGSIGNCDCGDFSLWKSSGFCTEHQGHQSNEHPENYLDEKLRETLTDIIFKACFESLEFLRTRDDRKSKLIIQFVSSFLKFGDGFRRLIAISLTEKIDFKRLISNVFESSLSFNQSLQQLCGGLINDQVFKTNFAMVNYDLILTKIIPDIYSTFPSDPISTKHAPFTKFWFQSYSPDPMKVAIEKFNWDWVSFAINFCEIFKEMFNLKLIVRYDINFPSVFSEISSNIYNAANVQPNEETQCLFDGLFSKALNHGTKRSKSNNTVVSVSFHEEHPEDYYYSIFLFNTTFYKVMKCFKLRKNLKFDVLIDQLDKTIDISPIFCINHNQNGNENDLFISKYVDKTEDISSILKNKQSKRDVPIERYFMSFHNGSAFFYAFPLFDSLASLFSQDNMSRIKIARLLSLSKYKKLRIQLGIVTLKNIIALVCSHQSLTAKYNYSILEYILPTVNNPLFINFGIPRIFSLLQLFIGLQSEDDKKLNEFSLKEFFAFEMARELGIFDDFTTNDYVDENTVEKQKEMIFSFLYLSLLLNVERTLFNFNGYYFMEEQIIYALKQGKNSIDQINKMCNSFVARMNKRNTDFDSIISKVAVSNLANKDSNAEDKDSYFTLKEGVEWKSISAINPLNGQKVLLNKEISKNPNKLIKIPKFSDESNYFFNPSIKIKANPEAKDDEDNLDSDGLNIKLKEFLMTPTVLAIVYHTLRTNADKNELNDHLAMNILVLISKFAEESSDIPLLEPSTVIQYNSTVIDLISKIKKVVFKISTDEEGNTNITNRLSRQNFRTFLNIKIGSSDLEPKSLIEILIVKGKLGKDALQQLSVDVEIDKNQSQKDSMKEAKKKLANKLKQNIMDHYKTVISSFNVNDDDATEETAEQECSDENCSICFSSKNDQILSYPLFIYRTKFPFIVDKPPLIENIGHSEAAVDDDNDIKSDQTEANLGGEYSLLLMLRRMFQERRQQSQKEEEEEEETQTSDLSQNVPKRCTEGNNFIIQFSLCQHPIHPSCVTRKWFQCPIDRSVKNGFLPCIDKFDPKLICSSEKVEPSSIQKSIVDSISSFISNFTSLFDLSVDKEKNLFIELIKSIAGLIVTFEARLRSLPDCLDSAKTKLLSRNLFLTVWYAYRLHGKPQIESTMKLTLFQKFIMKLIECDELEGIQNKKKEAFQQILTSFIQNDNLFFEKEQKRREKEIYLFLKRACLSDYFLLNDDLIVDQNQNKFIDWDEILSISFLIEKFKISLKSLNEDFEFKPIVFTKLSKEFIRLASEPFNFPVDKSSVYSVYNIIDYNFLIENHDDFDDENSETIEKVRDYSKNIQTFSGKNIFSELLFNYNKKPYPLVFIQIGKSASQVIVVCNNNIALLKPFYVDKFGCADIGFRRYQPLFLNEQKYERIVDQILSGDFSYNIQPYK